MTRSIAGVVLLVSLATPLRAQLVPAPNAPKALCFRGRPLPQCRAFWLTEFGLSLPDGPFGWELGGMRNVGKRSAVGGTGEDSAQGPERSPGSPVSCCWVCTHSPAAEAPAPT